MPATDALAVRTRVHEQLEGHTFRAVIDAFVDDQVKRGFSKFSSRASNKHLLSDNFARAMLLAETYYVSPEMHELVLSASTAPDFPHDETILISDPPSEAGFMYLPGRLKTIEMRGRVMIAHAIVWLGTSVWFLCDRRDLEDEMNQHISDTFGEAKHMTFPRYDLMIASDFAWNKPLPTQVRFVKGELSADDPVSFHKLDDGNIQMRTRGGGELHPISETSPELRFLLTTWRLMQQTLAEVMTEDDHPKGTRRNAERAKVPDTRVHVIQLRRRKSHATGNGPVLTHRFPVRGHWSRRWCGPADQRILRAVFIHSHIRGPEGTPLIIRERVNALLR